MKYYQNKTTNEIIGIENMREVISLPTKNSIKYGFVNHSYEIVYDMICPNVLIQNGVTSFCITYKMLSRNYKRIKASIALEKYPVFKQYSYVEFDAEKKRLGISGFEILKKQTF